MFFFLFPFLFLSRSSSLLPPLSLPLSSPNNGTRVREGQRRYTPQNWGPDISTLQIFWGYMTISISAILARRARAAARAPRARSAREARALRAGGSGGAAAPPANPKKYI